MSRFTISCCRIVYWVYALHAYRGLFEDQDRFFATRGADVRDLIAAYHRQYPDEDGTGKKGKEGGGGDGDGREE